MDHNPILVLTSSPDDMEFAIGDILQSQNGGPLIRVEIQRRIPKQTEAFITWVRPERLHHVYYSVASAPDACNVVVAAPCVAAMLGFLDEHRGTTSDFKLILLTATPLPQSQEIAVQTVNRLLEIGARPEQMGLVLTQAPDTASVRDAFPQLAQLRDEHLPELAFEAVVHESSIFARAREHQVPVASVLNGLVDFETALQQARQKGAEESALQALAKKVLVQRSLLAQRDKIGRAFSTLPFPRVSREDWLQKASNFNPSLCQETGIPGQDEITPGVSSELRSAHEHQ